MIGRAQPPVLRIGAPLPITGGLGPEAAKQQFWPPPLAGNRQRRRRDPPQVERAATSFSCGVRRIDDNLRQGLILQNLGRLHVALEAPGTAAVSGHYALHNGPSKWKRCRPKRGMSLRRNAILGAGCIVMFAVNREHRNQGIGTALFTDALRRVKRISEVTGTAVVVLDAIGERAETFYCRFGFDSLVSGTRRLFLPVSEIA